MTARTRSNTAHQQKGSHRVLFVLKSQTYGDPDETTRPLPYRIDLIRQRGVELDWTDRHRKGWWVRGRWRTFVEASERLATPWSQAWVSRHQRRNADALLSIFESEGHSIAAIRHLPALRSRPPLVILSCWLADIARSSSPTRRRLYRWLYRNVDRVIVFSTNQAETLTSLIGVPPEKISVVRFGVDLDALNDFVVTDSGNIVAAGRDLGRDWGTLADAARQTGWTVDLITRAEQLRGLSMPPEVIEIGVVDRATYLERLAAAVLVVIPTEIREYPTGQTVLLEAMALGKACVVTDTPAMREYAIDGETAVLIPPHDAGALRDAVNLLLADPVRRQRIGNAARSAVYAAGGATEMWSGIADVLEITCANSS